MNLYSLDHIVIPHWLHFFAASFFAFPLSNQARGLPLALPLRPPLIPLANPLLHGFVSFAFLCHFKKICFIGLYTRSVRP